MGDQRPSLSRNCEMVIHLERSMLRAKKSLSPVRITSTSYTNSGVEDGLILGIPYQLFGVVYPRDQFIGQLRKKHLCVWQIFRGFSPKDAPQF